MKAVALLSGGLDSTLAIKVVQEQGIEIIALNFLTPFCLCDKRGEGCSFLAKQAGDTLGIEVRRLYLGEEYLEIVKSPKHGYGKNLNPCIDCRILIFKQAKKIMKELGASFVITGEVLGQRPMSQHKRALSLIEKESELEGLILRPLSAKLLSPSIPEKEGWVNRTALLDFNGRARRPQMEMAHFFGIHNYPCSSGGCLLTDPSFSRRMKDLMNCGEVTVNNIELLKVGRHFRINEQYKLIVGRDARENKRILDLSLPSDVHFEPIELPGPSAIGRGNFDDGIKIFSAEILARYISPLNGKVKIEVIRNGGEKEELLVAGMEENVLAKWRI